MTAAALTPSAPRSLALSEHRNLRIATLSLLYFAQGLPFGFIEVAMLGPQEATIVVRRSLEHDMAKLHRFGFQIATQSLFVSQFDRRLCCRARIVVR